MKMIRSLIVTAAVIAPSFSMANTGDGVNIGGMVRANYSYLDYVETSKDKSGDFSFEVAAINFDGKLDDFGVSVQYRFNSTFDAIKHGYIYYSPNGNLTLNAGIVNVPFGNIGFNSNGFWLSLPYYAGFEDDYDAGASMTYRSNGYRTDLAFLKSSEYDASVGKGYGTDIFKGTVNGTRYANEETNQLSLRHTMETQFFGIDSVLGASVQIGQIYNVDTGAMGSRNAYSVHYSGKLDDWSFLAQVMKYEYDQKDIVDPSKIAMSVTNARFEIASEATIYTASIAKLFKTSWGGIKVYNDLGILTPKNSEYDDSILNSTGLTISSGPVFCFVDFIVGKNMALASRSGHIGLKDVFDEYDKRFNFNIGYYF